MSDDDELFGLKSSRTGEYLHSESADEMFEKLGYRDVTIGTISRCLYANGDKRISFNRDRTFEVYDFYDGSREIDMQELQAINEKVKELKWNE